MFKVAIDNGHGLETPGKRTPPFEDGTQIKEKEFNRPTAVFLMSALNRCGIETVDCAPGWDDISLGGRVKLANESQASAFVSVHYNAFKGVWGQTTGGVETYHYPGSVQGEKLASCVQKYLAQGTEMPNRGVKSYNFYVCRETSMPAILCECGFMDVRSQAELMLDEDYQKECAEEICQGVCEYLGTSYVAPGEEVEPVANEYKGCNLDEYYKTPILGLNLASVAYLWGYAESRDHNVPPEVPQLYLDISERYGVRGDIAFCQAMKETNFFQFTGVAQYDWHNPCGLGVTGDADVGCRFSTWERGVLAHIQHLAVYADIQVYPDEIIDPRHAISARANKWTELNGQWAVPGETYGQDIMKMYIDMCNTEPKAIPQEIEVPDYIEIIDQQKKEIAQLKADLNAEHEESELLYNSLEVKKMENKELDTEIEVLTNAASNKDLTIEELKAKLATKEESINFFNKVIERLSNENEELSQAIDELTKQNEILNEVVDERDKEIETLKLKVPNEQGITQEQLKAVSLIDWLKAQFI